MVGTKARTSVLYPHADVLAQLLGDFFVTGSVNSRPKDSSLQINEQADNIYIYVYKYVYIYIYIVTI